MVPVLLMLHLLTHSFLYMGFIDSTHASWPLVTSTEMQYIYRYIYVCNVYRYCTYCIVPLFSSQYFQSSFSLFLPKIHFTVRPLKNHDLYIFFKEISLNFVDQKPSLKLNMFYSSKKTLKTYFFPEIVYINMYLYALLGKYKTSL